MLLLYESSFTYTRNLSIQGCFWDFKTFSGSPLRTIPEEDKNMKFSRSNFALPPNVSCDPDYIYTCNRGCSTKNINDV